jgi:hypothetical protein
MDSPTLDRPGELVFGGGTMRWLYLTCAQFGAAVRRRWSVIQRAWVTCLLIGHRLIRCIMHAAPSVDEEPISWGYCGLHANALNADKRSSKSARLASSESRG